jgi:hypothetical protein
MQEIKFCKAMTSGRPDIVLFRTVRQLDNLASSEFEIVLRLLLVDIWYDILDEGSPSHIVATYRG